jgi:hypothetical protein
MQTKVLLVGNDTWLLYVKAFYNAYRKLGYENVELFATNRYMESGNKLSKLEMRIENKLALGSRVDILNKNLLEHVKKMKPDLVFFYAERLIYPQTIKRIKESGAKVFMYNNDDPFAKFYPRYYWRHYRAGLKYSDIAFVYRSKNIDECRKVGCKKIEMLRSYYIEERNYYMPYPKIKVPEVVFLGHYENDGRARYMKRLVDEGITIGVNKSQWPEFEPDNPRVIKLDMDNGDYNEKLNSAKIAIVFLSKINNDTYTRRCFEIPAAKTLMVAPYTEDLASLFKEDEEVVFYRNEDDFARKVKYYLNNDVERNKIAEAGYERVKRDGHEVTDRVKFVMQCYNNFR